MKVAISGGTAIALVACQLGERFGYVTPTPEGTKTIPTETVLPPSTGTIPTSAAETATATSVEFLGQDEVLATKLSETLTLENLYVKFKEDTQIKALFANPDAVEYSAMGIKASMAESGKTVTYPFFSATSETEKKGYTAMVLQPSAEEVVYQVLNRTTDAEGKVGLGITQDLNHQLLEKPVMVFTTGLTADQIAKMTDEELSQINLLFVPAGLPVLPSEAPLGVGNYLASLKPIEPTPTPETPALPQDLLTQFPGASIEKTESGWEAKDSQGNPIAWYDTKDNEWITRYHTLFEISEYPPNPDWLHFNWIKKEGGFVATDEGDELASRNVVFAGRVKKVFTEMVPNSVGFTKIYWMTMIYGNGDKTVNVLLFTEHNKTLPEAHGAGWLILDKDNPDYYGPSYMPEKDHYSQEQVLAALKTSYFIQVRISLYREKYLSEFKNSKYLINDNDIYRSGYLQVEHSEEQLQLVDALLGGNFEGVKDGIPLGAEGTWIFTSP